MATQRISLDWGLLPALTTRMEPATIEDANDLSGSDVATIDDGSTDDGVWFRLDNVPSNYASGTAPTVIAPCRYITDLGAPVVPLENCIMQRESTFVFQL